MDDTSGGVGSRDDWIHGVCPSSGREYWTKKDLTASTYDNPFENGRNDDICLDAEANFPNHTLVEYCTACSNAVDTALATFQTASNTAHATVAHGFVDDNRLLSMFWTTTFQAPDPQLLPHLHSLFHSKDLKTHALQWDNTFHDCAVLGTLPNTGNTGDLSTDPLLVHWQFNAAPLSGRDMLYVVSTKEEQPTKNDAWVKRTTYAYASVTEEWVHNATEKDTHIQYTGRVRSKNTFPSCDRVTIFKDRVQLDHLMTTDIGGWVSPCCFNHLFKSALVEANKHEYFNIATAI
jgi:hypothetical protein